MDNISVSKKQKLLERLNRKPSPKDFTWEELLTLMRQYDFVESCSKGSHYMFDHETGYRFRMSKTHPSGILKQYQIDEAILAISVVAVGDNHE